MKRNALTSQLAILLVGVLTAAVAVIVLFSHYRATKTFEAALIDQGGMIRASFEAGVVDTLLVKDYVTLRRQVDTLREKQPVVAFAAVSNSQGMVVAHSDHALEGKSLSETGGPDEKSLAGAGLRRRIRNGENLLEFWAPVDVAGKREGTVVVGVSLARTDRAVRGLTLSIALAAFGALSMAIAVSASFMRRFGRKLEELVAKAGEIAGGDLTVKVPEEGAEELQALARAFNAMAGNLRNVIRQIQETGGAVGQFSSGITTVIQDQATSASQQAASLAEVTATMEELSRTSHQIAGNAESVKSSAEQTVEMAQQGTALVQESVAGMGRIKERVTDIAQKTLFLGEKSHEIGKVMDLIKEIAGEIHLLALNAAIESAAAGEHGRRFAVVASEVRRLAEKTRESTETIRALVSEIQSATQGSIQATEQGNREVDKWRETINLTAGAFEEIIGMIEKTSEASMQISLATHQQTSANDQVVTGMRQVAEMVRLTASHMKESSASAAELKGMAAMLTEKTSVFRV
jgi:methyl-accepting chemotaxis protein